MQQYFGYTHETEIVLTDKISSTANSQCSDKRWLRLLKLLAIKSFFC